MNSSAESFWILGWWDMSYVKMVLEMRMRKREGAFVDEVVGGMRMGMRMRMRMRMEGGVYILCN
jgi:hypothetical protein